MDNDLEQLGVHAYMRQAAHAIGRAFQADGLGCTVGGGVQGPHTLTFGVRLVEATKANIQKALGLKHAVEHACNVSPVRIFTEDGWLWIEIPSPWPHIVYAASLTGQRKSLAVPLGMTSRQQVYGIDFEIEPHLLVIGPTDSGKTTAIRAMLFQLARQNRAHTVGFYIITVKPRGWRAFSDVLNTRALIEKPDEAIKALNWMARQMPARLARKNPEHDFIVIDDAINLIAMQPEIAQPMREIASLGREAGMHLIIGTQSGGRDGFGDSIIGRNIRHRLVFGTASAHDAALASGRSSTGAEALGKYKGDALHITEHHIFRVAVALVQDSDLPSVARYGSDRPWLSGTGTSTSTAALSKIAANGQDRESSTSTSTSTGTPVLPFPATLESGGGVFPWRVGGPTAEERAQIREWSTEGISINQISLRAWGKKKMPTTYRWIRGALDEGAESEASR